MARKSKIDKEGVSSIKIGASDKRFTLTFNCSHSWGSRFPLRSFSEVKPVSEDIILVINWTDDISREKTATAWLKSIAIFLAIEITKAVFPIPGRAAIIIKSDGCQPEVIASSFVKPVAKPLIPSLLEISWIFDKACLTKSLAPSELFFKFPCVTSKSLASALSNKSNTSDVSS